MVEDFAEPLDDSMDEEIKSVDEELGQCLHTNNFAYNNFIPIFFHAILLYRTSFTGISDLTVRSSSMSTDISMVS